jgi:Cdc6-like AAA superfamily ATPase
MELPAHFTGRTTELAALDDVLATAETSSSVTICVIAGAAGIGKTVLAVY